MAARPNVQAADVAARMACKADAKSIRATQPMMSFAAESLERQLAGSGEGPARSRACRSTIR